MRTAYNASLHTARMLATGEPERWGKKMKMNRGIIIAALALVATFAHATPQVGESMTYRGTNHCVYGFGLRKDMQENFEKWREKGNGVIISSANWGGWYADLKVRDDKLYLTGLDIDRPDRIRPFNGPSIKTVFGVRVPRKGVFAEWFTGELKEPLGKPMIFYSKITEKIRVFTFEKGVLKTVEIRESDYAKELREKKEHGSTNNVIENTGTNAPDSQH